MKIFTWGGKFGKISGFLGTEQPKMYAQERTDPDELFLPHTELGNVRTFRTKLGGSP